MEAGEDFDAKIARAAVDLERDGYAVIRGILPVQEIDALVDQAWATVERASGGELTRDRDYGRMKAKDLLPHKHGIIESGGFNHAPWVRQLRRDPRILRIYAALYGTDQLVSSMDRVNFKFPGRRYESQAPWPHFDQNFRRVGRVTIQSYVALTDCLDPAAPGNRLYRGSHAVFETRYAQQRSDQSTENWQKLSESDAAALALVCPLEKPLLGRGDMLLWDSRTAHSPDDGTDFTQGRIVVYLCYNRLWEKAGDPAFLVKKKSAFQKCRATRHSPNPQHLFGKGPRLYDGEKPRYYEFSKQQLGIVGDEPVGAERYLFGFEAYRGREGLLLGRDWQAGWRGLPLLQFVSPYAKLEPPVIFTEPKKKRPGAEKDRKAPAKKAKKT